MRAHSLIIVSMVTVIAGCSRAPVVTIANESSLILSNVVISGSGVSERVGSIPAGGEHRLSVRPRGESGLRLVFDARNRHVDSGEQGYFEAGGGYRIAATVSTNLSVSVSSGLRQY